MLVVVIADSFAQLPSFATPDGEIEPGIELYEGVLIVWPFVCVGVGGVVLCRCVCV